MIFSSYPFIFGFLPAVVLVVLLLRRFAPGHVVVALALASLAFYAYWDWRFLWIILLSIGVNYAVGLRLGRQAPGSGRPMLALGIAFNLGLLGFFKYTNFLLDNIEVAVGGPMPDLAIVLPLGISFFTFQQIAYLVDVYRRQAIEHDFKQYLLFVAFFPQLIAGPIVHHLEMMPQFVSGRAGRLNLGMVAQGVAVFFVGVAKKVLIADHIARFATPVFEASANGVPIPLVEAWGGALAYTFQIYFDFSAYSDMAIGLGLIFGLRLPINFNSPYKATNLVDFWRRWHITLSRFLRDYLYFPLGGNRKGGSRRYVNLMVVMLLGGLWHGAAWTFVIWGGLHGLGLVVNRLWWHLRGAPSETMARGGVSRVFGWALTFLFVVVTWVFFRAVDLDSALNVLAGMAGLNGVVLPDTYLARLGGLGVLLLDAGVTFKPVYLFLGAQQVMWLAALLGIVVLAPNTLQWAGYEPALDAPAGWNTWSGWLRWRPSVPWAFGLSCVTLVALVLMSDAGEFLYFQF